MQISAFIDGELPETESELLLRRLSQDAELRRVVARYMEIGHNLRQDAGVPEIAQLRQRIAEDLGAEPHDEEMAAEPSGNRYVKPLAGFAVAASVAVMAIFGLQQANTPTADIEAVAGTYTQPPVDDRLDEMFRLHDNAYGNAGSTAILTEFVTLEINEDELVKVEPKAKLVAPVEIGSEAADDAADTEETDVLTD